MRERQPTPEEFEKLLSWFDSDRDTAGHKFNLIHSRLIKVFASRGCVDSESLADEVINRVAVRIDTVKVNYSDPIRCCMGFVEYVHREYRRDEEKTRIFTGPPPRRPADELEKEDVCLEQCLEKLPKTERDLLVLYFQGEKRDRINRRKKLAEERLLTLNALRLRAHHLRKEMHHCIVTCLTQN